MGNCLFCSKNDKLDSKFFINHDLDRKFSLALRGSKYKGVDIHAISCLLSEAKTSAVLHFTNDKLEHFSEISKNLLKNGGDEYKIDY